jgi:hypothetical protein
MATTEELAQAIYRQEGTDCARLNNNPGCLKYAGQSGATGASNGFAVFSSLDAGWAALRRQIELDASRGLTLKSFIYKYAPPSENPTATYLSNVSSWLGLSPSTPLSDVVAGSPQSPYGAPDTTEQAGILSGLGGSTTVLLLLGLALAVVILAPRD